METPFFQVMRLTREEGKAAAILGRKESDCPYKINEHSRDMELRGYWLSGYAEWKAIK